MKKLGITFIFAIALLSTAVGQQYKTAIGVKGGFPYYGSLNLKHFFGASAGEFRLGAGRNTFFFQGLYERNYGLGQGFDWYWGLGGHIGFWNYGNNQGHYHHDHYYNSGSYGGVDAVLGIEYTFTQIPLNFAFDVGPSFRLFPYTEFYFGGALAARFAIK